MNESGPITYFELEYWFRIGLRNGSFHRLKREQKGLLRACLMLARRVGAIFSEVVVSQLRDIFKILKPLGRRALEAGREKAEEMLKYFKRSGVFKWAPQVRLWLMDKAYILYLGFMHLNEPSRYYYEA